MTRAQPDRAVAGRTGESPRTIRLPGSAIQLDHPAPEELRLVVACPLCGRAVPYPGRAGDGSPALAECPDPSCDIYFDFDPSRVHAPVAWADHGDARLDRAPTTRKETRP
jgi:hypothetical protein